MAGHGKGAAQDPDLQRGLIERARLEVIASVLPLKMWLNPSWAVVAIIPFAGLFPAFGNVTLWRLALAVFTHLANSAVAAVFFLRYRRDPSDRRGWLAVLTAFQALVGMSWGVMVWLLWVPGNELNHAVVMLPIMAVLWTNSAAKIAYWRVYAAGAVPIYGLPLIRLLASGERASLGLAGIYTLAFAYTLIVAYAANRQTYNLIFTGLANQNLTTELRAARDDALRKRHEAETANATKTTFLANMSHELRTPLNAILGFSEIIGEGTFGPIGVARYRDYAHDIHASGSHLLSIINDILDIAKIESGKMGIEPVWIDTRSAIDDALRVLTPRMKEKGQHLSVRIAPGAGIVYADERAFKQVLLNLATNAVKFTQLGGEITIHGRPEVDGGFELIVEDNGPGIEPAALEHVFLPFNQMDNRYSRHQGGTGLGLSLVRGLAVLHGGKAWLETEQGHGVRAHVYFPSGNAVSKPDVTARLSA